MFNAAATDSELCGLQSVQIGPETKEYNLLRADEEYCDGNVENSIYYQVRALYQSADLRLITESKQLLNRRSNSVELLSVASAKEKREYKTNNFLRNILKKRTRFEEQQGQVKSKDSIPDSLDFLKDVEDPQKGFQLISSEVYQELPQEWCILQLCKSFNPATTYSTFSDIAASKGNIYVTLLRHCRSPELPPISLSFNNDALADIFKDYSTLVERYRRVVTVDPLAMKAQEAKAKYWKELNAFGEYLKKLIDDFGDALTPYCVMFLGKRYDSAAVQQQTKAVYEQVDKLCLEQGWSNQQRILLSQAALHANRLPQSEMKLLSYELTHQNQSNYNNNNYNVDNINNETEPEPEIEPEVEAEAQRVYELLQTCSDEWEQLEQDHSWAIRRYPVILVVDERLDQLHWEQLAPMQEMTRIKSLHNLLRLYKYHKAQIKHGYYTVSIDRGISIINPDADLVNSGRRLRGFLEYWLSHWNHMFETKPTEKMMTKQAFKADCFVYAGHGSTLQYVSSRVICHNRIRGVVFLFGCDSTRVLSTGLYSALHGAHDYYHGALCPTVVGTLMPALDANMDNVSATVLSRWIRPGNQQVIPWTHIDRPSWLSQGIVKAEKDYTDTLEQEKNYQMGSLSYILSTVHMGEVEQKIYNNCIYVCRGLPAWNLAVEEMPF